MRMSGSTSICKGMDNELEAVDSKTALDTAGNFSSDPALTHFLHNLSNVSESINHIYNLVNRVILK